MKKIVLITSNELRHKFLQSFLNYSKDINLIFCIEEQINEFKHEKISLEQLKHLKKRDRSEIKFFKQSIKRSPKIKNLIKTKKNQINTDTKIQRLIIKEKPDFIIAFGCSIIKKKVINLFKSKIINIHLGLSPYYKGTGTNFWPFVNNKLQLVGVTFMLMDEGIDTGPIINQLRAKFYKSDDIHMACNRLIKNMSKSLIKILLSNKKFQTIEQKTYSKEKIFYRKDFNDEALIKLKKNFSNGMVPNYLKSKKKLDKIYPIIENKIYS